MRPTHIVNVVRLTCHIMLVDAEATVVRDTQALLSRCSSSSKRNQILSPDSDDPELGKVVLGAQER